MYPLYSPNNETIKCLTSVLHAPIDQVISQARCAFRRQIKHIRAFKKLITQMVEAGFPLSSHKGYEGGLACSRKFCVCPLPMRKATHSILFIVFTSLRVCSVRLLHLFFLSENIDIFKGLEWWIFVGLIDSVELPWAINAYLWGNCVVLSCRLNLMFSISFFLVHHVLLCFFIVNEKYSPKIARLQEPKEYLHQNRNDQVGQCHLLNWNIKCEFNRLTSIKWDSG